MQQSVAPRERRGIFYGWWVVVGTMALMFLSYGIRYSFGVFLVPLTNEFGWTRTMTAGVFSLYMVVYGVGSLLLGSLADRYGPRVICSVGAVFLGGGLLVATFTTDLWQLYLSYGLLTALGAGAMYVPPGATLTNWFVRRRGLALGLGQIGVGMGTFVMNPVSAALVTSSGWRMAFTLTGAATVVVGVVIAAALMRRRPEDMGLLPDGDPPQEIAGLGQDVLKAAGHNAERDLGLVQAMRTYQFWVFLAGYLLAVTGIQAIYVHLVAYATDVGISPMVAASVVGFIGLISVAGRIGIGWLGDRIGRRQALVLILVMLAATMWWLMAVRDVGMLWAWAAVYAFFYGGIGPTTSGFLADRFGRTFMGSILGASTVAAGVGGAIGPVYAGWLYDSTGSYLGAYTGFAVFFLLAAVFMFFVRPVRQRLAQPTVAPGPQA